MPKLSDSFDVGNVVISHNNSELNNSQLQDTQNIHRKDHLLEHDKDSHCSTVISFK